MKRTFLHQIIVLLMFAAVTLIGPMAHADEESPDELIKRLLTDVTETIKSDKALRTGNLNKISALVDARIMPTVNFERMTASVVGPLWRQASAEQQRRLQEEFKTLLVNAYAGALAQLKDQTIHIKPLKALADDKTVLVRADVKGKGETIQLDYRLEKIPGAGWKIYNLNIMGVWLVETYRSQFAQELNAKGVDGLIADLVERNKSNAKKG